MSKPEALYGELQGVVGYWYPEMDMDLWINPIKKKAENFLIPPTPARAADAEPLDGKLMTRIDQCLNKTCVSNENTFCKRNGVVITSEGFCLDKKEAS